MVPSRALCFYQSVSLILGIVLLLYTRSNIKSGRADLFAFFYHRGGPSDAEVSREDSGCLFWLVIVLQVILGIVLIEFGPKLERELGIGPLWELPPFAS